MWPNILIRLDRSLPHHDSAVEIVAAPRCVCVASRRALGPWSTGKHSGCSPAIAVLALGGREQIAASAGATQAH